jgi:hypothetical protein
VTAAQKPLRRHKLVSEPVLDGPYVCPECLVRFRPKATRQLFCCAEHKRSWYNRSMKRGGKLFSVVAAARETRDGTRGAKDVGKQASAEANLLLQGWRDEDRTAGRMGQVEYMRRRYVMGFDAI